MSPFSSTNSSGGHAQLAAKTYDFELSFCPWAKRSAEAASNMTRTRVPSFFILYLLLYGYAYNEYLYIDCQSLKNKYTEKSELFE
jgi:hypothetical protein